MVEAPEDHLADLLVDSLAGRLTGSRRQELADWGQSDPGVSQLISDFGDPIIAGREMAAWVRIDPKKAYRQWRRRRLRKNMQYAAALLVVLLTGTLVWWWRPGDVNLPAMAASSFEEKALSASGDNDSTQMRVLPDGTKVWLNSKSKLYFPARFTGKERLVELSGEAYFDVVRQTTPFVVKAGDVRVKVLGTRFDIMAYPDDDSIQAILINGAVEVWKGTSKVQLAPGEQVVVARRSPELAKARNVNWSHVMAWRENAFYFPAHTNLRTVLKEIARWYDVQPEYHGRIPDREEAYGGRIQRNLPLQDVLDALQFPGVRFWVAGHRLIVEPGNSN